MRRFLILLSIGYAVCAYSETVDIQDVIDAGLPVLYVETIDGVEPTYDVIEAPEGQNGTGITNATKVAGRVRIELGGVVLYDSGDYVAKASGMTIKVRGNTSAAHSIKKPYKIKLQQKADMLCRGNDTKYADKNWVLLKDEGLKTKVGFKVNELLGLQWTPQFMYVNVIFNGEYRGLYMLAESVERNTKGRLDVGKTGYIVELDAYWWNEDKYFMSSLSDKMNYTYKYPDSDDVTEEQNDYIQTVMNALEASLPNGSYPDYIDVNSFASWMLGHDLLSSKDGDGSNMYLTKYDNGVDSKIMMANLWDFDGAMDYTVATERWADVHWKYYFKSFFNNPNKTFVRAYKEKWNQIKTTFFDEIDIFLDEYSSSEECAALERSLIMDNARWNRSLTTVTSRISTMRTWFTSRKTWLESNITAINDREATYSNSVAIVNEGTIKVDAAELNDAQSFTSTACSDVNLKFIPGTNMTLTYVKVDDIDVTEDVVNNEFIISHVLGSHAIEVRYDRTIVPMQAVYATYCSTADLDFSAVEGIDAYIAKSYDFDNGSVLLEKVNQAPAGTGLLLVGTANVTYQIPTTNSASSISDNLLIGVNEDTTISPSESGYNNYILANRTAGLGFYKLTGSGTLTSGKSYLHIPGAASAASALLFDFTDDNGYVTGIKVELSTSEEDGTCYNLSGQRVINPKKGVYVKKGMKIIKR